MAISDNITVATFLPSSFPDDFTARLAAMLEESEQTLEALFNSEEYKRSEQELAALLSQAQAETEQILQALLISSKDR